MFGGHWKCSIYLKKSNACDKDRKSIIFQIFIKTLKKNDSMSEKRIALVFGVFSLSFALFCLAVCKSRPAFRKSILKIDFFSVSICFFFNQNCKKYVSISEKRIALVLCVLLPFELSVYLQRKLEPNFRNIFLLAKWCRSRNCFWIGANLKFLGGVHSLSCC